MRVRFHTALAAILVLLIAAPALAAEGEIKRAANGKPDLTGTYDAATLTPLQRPEEYGENLYLTPEEAEKIATDAAKARADRHQVSDPDREAPPEGGDGSPGAAGNVGGYNSFWLDRGTATFAVDGKFRTSIIIDPPNGRMPETTDAAKARFGRVAARKLRRPNEGVAWWLELDGPGPYDGPESLPISERCILGFTGATPTFPSGYNNYKRVVQTEDHIMILIEMVHDARIIRLNDEHPSPEERRWLGDSVGWWEGDTLVIDSVHFRPDGFLRGATKGPPRHGAPDAAAGRQHPLPLHDGRPGHLGSSLVRRVHLEARPGTRLRVRLPRGQLLHGRHAPWRAHPRGRLARRQGGQHRRRVTTASGGGGSHPASPGSAGVGPSGRSRSRRE